MLIFTLSSVVASVGALPSYQCCRIPAELKSAFWTMNAEPTAPALKTKPISCSGSSPFHPALFFHRVEVKLCFSAFALLFIICLAHCRAI